MVDQVRNRAIAITFRRYLPRDLRLQWDQIWSDVLAFNLVDESNTVLWTLEKNNKFSVKSMYNALTRSETGIYYKMLWKGKILAKIKLFMRLLMNDAILTKDNLLKRNWQGDPACYFCDDFENISHLFFQCHVAKSMWAIVAKCFGADTIPRNLEQSWRWCNRWLPFGRKYHVLGVSAICFSHLEIPQ